MPAIPSSASFLLPNSMEIPPDIPSDVVACIATASVHYGLDPRITFDKLNTRKARTRGGIGAFQLTQAELVSAGITEQMRSVVRSDDCLNASIAVLVEAKQLRDQQRLASTSTLPTATNGAGARQGPRLPRLDALGEQCVDAASTAYGIPNPIFRAVLRTEGGWQGLRKRNANGSYDLGPGQINTIHLPALRKYGIDEQMLADDVCLNVHVAAYRLRLEIDRVRDVWRGVGNYHSRTPKFHNAYLARVRSHL